METATAHDNGDARTREAASLPHRRFKNESTVKEEGELPRRHQRALFLASPGLFQGDSGAGFLMSAYSESVDATLSLEGHPLRSRRHPLQP